MSWPSKVILPPVGSSRRMMQRAMVDLPQPDSPTTPSVSPLRHGEGDAVDRLDAADLLLEDDAAGNREVLLEVLDLEQRLRRSAPFDSTIRAPPSCHRPAASPRSPESCSRWQATRCSEPLSTPRARPSARSVERIAAAQVEATAAGRVQERRRRAGDRLQLGAVRGQPRKRAEQSPGVRVLGLVEDLRVGALLGRPGGVHHEHVVGRLGDDAEVVGDQDDRRCRSRAGARSSASGSAPGWSRRAPSSARRRSAGRGC